MQTKIEYDVIKCWLNLKDDFEKAALLHSYVISITK